jgi:hypothetical protein
VKSTSPDSDNEDNNKKEFNQPDYDEDEDQIEEKTRRANWKSSNLNNNYKSSFLEFKKNEI